MKKILFITTLIAFIVGCNHDDDSGINGNANNYPKSVSIEFKVESSTTTTGNVSISLESGSDQLSNIDMPYSKTYSITVNENDYVSLAAFNSNGVTMDMSILVDGKEVAKKTAAGNEFVSDIVGYYFE